MKFLMVLLTRYAKGDDDLRVFADSMLQAWFQLMQDMGACS